MITKACILAERCLVRFASKGLERHMPMSGVLLVIVETGAKLPAWLASCQDKVTDTVVLVAAVDETPSRFARRASQRIQHLGDSDHRIQAAVVVPADEVVSDEALSSRQKICESVLAQLAHNNRGRLLLLTGGALQAEAQLELLNLAGALSERLHGTKLTVALHFGAAAHSEPPRELLEPAPNSHRGASRRPSSRSSTTTRTVPPQDVELVSAVVQTSDTGIESTG
jgi:hypothetical protein